VQNNPLNRIDPDGKLDWEPVKGQPGKWKAQPGDSAWSLSKDANISPEKANQIVESQLGPNYVKDGKEYSNVEVGDVVEIEPENVAEVSKEQFIKYPKDYKKNQKKIDSIDKKIDYHYAEIDNYNDVIRDEIKNGSQEGPHNVGLLLSMEMLIHDTHKKIAKEKHIKDSIKRVSKPDTFNYEVIRVKKNNNKVPPTLIQKDEFKK